MNLEPQSSTPSLPSNDNIPHLPSTTTPIKATTPIAMLTVVTMPHIGAFLMDHAWWTFFIAMIMSITLAYFYVVIPCIVFYNMRKVQPSFYPMSPPRVFPLYDEREMKKARNERLVWEQRQAYINYREFDYADFRRRHAYYFPAQYVFDDTIQTYRLDPAHFLAADYFVHRCPRAPYDFEWHISRLMDDLAWHFEVEESCKMANSRLPWNTRLYLQMRSISKRYASVILVLKACSRFTLGNAIYFASELASLLAIWIPYLAEVYWSSVHATDTAVSEVEGPKAISTMSHMPGQFPTIIDVAYDNMSPTGSEVGLSSTHSLETMHGSTFLEASTPTSSVRLSPIDERRDSSTFHLPSPLDEYIFDSPSSHRKTSSPTRYPHYSTGSRSSGSSRRHTPQVSNDFHDDVFSSDQEASSSKERVQGKKRARLLDEDAVDKVESRISKKVRTTITSPAEGNSSDSDMVLEPLNTKGKGKGKGKGKMVYDENGRPVNAIDEDEGLVGWTDEQENCTSEPSDKDESMEDNSMCIDNEEEVEDDLSAPGPSTRPGNHPSSNVSTAGPSTSPAAPKTRHVRWDPAIDIQLESASGRTTPMSRSRQRSSRPLDDRPPPRADPVRRTSYGASPLGQAVAECREMIKKGRRVEHLLRR